MTEPVQTPEQQAAAPVQPVPTTPVAPAGEDWKARYDGLVKKVEQLVGEARTKDTELATLRTQIEQLNAQLGLKDAEKNAAVSERDKQIQDLVGKTETASQELARLRSLEAKLKVANELGRPDLMKIAQHIPNVEDAEALKTIMQDFAGFAESAAKEREKQLMAGVGPAAGTSPSAASQPQTAQEWERLYNGLPLGSKERADAMNRYGDWLFSQHK